jgi:hypothetical protein
MPIVSGSDSPPRPLIPGATKAPACIFLAETEGRTGFAANLLDLRSSRQFGLETIGHAVCGIASLSSPAATSVWIEPEPEGAYRRY